jgi:hypothetical protein
LDNSGTDDQNLTGATLTTTTNILQIDIESGASTSVDLSPIVLDNDPTNEIELPATANSNDVLTWDGNAWVAQASPSDADWTIDINGNMINANSGTVSIGVDANVHGLTIGRGNGSNATNTALGSDALYSNTNGDNNTASGNNALYSNMTGYKNTANGNNALYSNTNGYHNTANGDNALQSNTTGHNNTAIGHSALENNISGGTNTAIGMYALRFVATGSRNTATGYLALKSATGTDNVAFGYAAGENITGGDRNIIIGSDIDIPDPAGSYQLNIGNLIYGTDVDGINDSLSTGNIGIGVTSPSEKLDVYGNINLSGTIIQDSWQSPVFSTSWVDFGGTSWETAAYYMDKEGVVHLRGVVTGGTAGTTIFILPPGYSPINNRMFSGLSSQTGGTGLVLTRIDVMNNGHVILHTGGDEYVSLEGISFRP